MSWERHLFTVGERYRVRKGFVSGTTRFNLGEIVVFERDGYSYYDNCFAYEFRDPSDGQLKTWWVHEDAPTDEWKEYFEPAQLE